MYRRAFSAIASKEPRTARGGRLGCPPAKARDCGANVVIRKPVSPQILFDRLAWVSRVQRPFIECESYIGPDRRFKSIGPPGGVGRRSTDLSADVGTAKEPNMSQDEIDMLFKPAKIAAS